MKKRAICPMALMATAAALLSLAATASATTITSSSGTTPTINATAGSTTLDGTLDVTCNNSSMSGAVDWHGSGVTVKGDINTLTYTSCGDDTVVVLSAGELEVHATSGGNGTLTSTGTQITIIADTIFGDIHCVFTTHQTHVGTLTAGTHAKLDIDSSIIPRTGGSGGALCGEDGEWTGSYTVNSPTNLSVDA